MVTRGRLQAQSTDIAPYTFTGWLRIKSGSILGPWLIHASANVAMCLNVAIQTAT